MPLSSKESKQDLKEIQEVTMGDMNYMICKCHGKVLSAQDESSHKQGSMDVDEQQKRKHVVFDNLYDIIFNEAGEPKQGAH